MQTLVQTMSEKFRAKRWQGQGQRSIMSSVSLSGVRVFQNKTTRWRTAACICRMWLLYFFQQSMFIHSVPFIPFDGNFIWCIELNRTDICCFNQFDIPRNVICFFCQSHEWSVFDVWPLIVTIYSFQSLISTSCSMWFSKWHFLYILNQLQLHIDMKTAGNHF